MLYPHKVKSPMKTMNNQQEGLPFASFTVLSDALGIDLILIRRNLTSLMFTFQETEILKG